MNDQGTCARPAICGGRFGWWQWVAMGAGGLTCLLGGAVLVGWHTRTLALLQMVPGTVVMQYNTALAFALCGGSLLAAGGGRRGLRLGLAGGAGVLGALSLVEYIAAVDLGIDQLLMTHYLTERLSYPGRMAPNTALCLVLFALAMGLRNVRFRGKPAGLLPASLAALVLVLGAASLMGYLLGPPIAIGWYALTRMAVPTAAGICVLGAGALALAWGWEAPSRRHTWLSLWVAMLFLAITLGVCQAQEIRLHRQLRQLAQARAEALARETSDHFQAIVKALLRMSRRWSLRDSVIEAEWRVDAASYVHELEGLQAVAWVDPSYHVRWREPRAGHEAPEGTDVRATPMHLAAIAATVNQRAPVASRTLELEPGRRGFVLYVPVYAEETLLGLIEATFSVDAFVDAIGQDMRSDFLLRIHDDQYLLYSSGGARELVKSWESCRVVLLGEISWTISAAPTHQLSANADVQRLTLAVGAMLGLLAATAVFFGQVAGRRARELDGHRLRLEEEVAGRTQDLHKRVKELRCINRISSLVQTSDSLEALLGAAAKILPSGWLFPELTGARIAYAGQVYASAPFADTPWRQACEIIAEGQACGRVEVFYLAASLPASGSPFLPEEQDLVENLAVLLGRAIERRLSEAAVLASEAKFRRLVRLAPLPIACHDRDGKLSFVNDRFVSTFGYTLADVPTLEEWWLRAYPDPAYRQRVRQISRQALANASQEQAELEPIEYDITCKNGAVRTLIVGGITLDVGVLVTFMDITDRKLVERHLHAVNDELKRSNQELEQFAYVASHDLQEPLRMVASYTQLLGQRYEAALDEKGRKWIDYAVDGANRMQGLISDLLAYSRITTRGAPLAAVDSHACLGAALANLRLAIEESSALVTNGELPMVRGDASQLAQLFQNLLGNALKYHGPEAPRVHVSARLEEERWLFAVRDNGIGIDPKYSDRIFQIFKRLHTRQEYPGTGIGLAVCKRIVERHGGKLWFDSAPGQGATFFFTLAKLAPDAAPPPMGDSDHA